jgi:uncharacterized protein
MKESEKFRSGVTYFNAQQFFEAHEVWEEVWLVEPEPEKTFLQGLIQLAAAFHHYGRGNLRGARSLLAAGIAKLARFADDHSGLALAKLRGEAGQWAKILEAEKSPGRRRPPQIQFVTGAQETTEKQIPSRNAVRDANTARRRPQKARPGSG